MVGIGSSCGACKFLRRKCDVVCIFAPYFSYDQSEVHFAAVHKVFGASNVSKLLSHLPMYHRSAAAFTLTYEAQARIRDPVRGCVSHILALHHQVGRLQVEIDALTAQLAPDSATDPGSSSSQPLMEFVDKFDVCTQRGIQEAYTSLSDIGEQSPQGSQAVFKEAIDQLEHCLFSDEPSLWEELSMSALDKDLAY